MDFPVRCVFLLFILTLGCRPDGPYVYTYQKTAFGKDGMVVSAHPLATQAGIDILKQGGNAIDACIATQLALAVVYPRAGNLGGGGFMIYRQADGSLFALDYREKAPKAATKTMYLDSIGNVIQDLSLNGHLAVGIPGTIAGLSAAHQRCGKLPWKTLFTHAVALARKSHPITSFEAQRLNEHRAIFLKYNRADIPFIKDSTWHEGDLLIQTALASTLERIAQNGSKEFYSGETARLIIEEMSEGNGIITLEDLANYQPVWRDPISANYKEYRVTSMPPPSSGGITLIQILKTLEPYPIDTWGLRDPRTVHLMIEAERRAFADRATLLADPDFYEVPVDLLLDAEYLKERMSNFDTSHATKSSQIETGAIFPMIETYETTHLSVVDRDGNVVAMTTTLNGNFGSKVLVDGAGFFLNNQMDDFTVKPGTPNLYGLITGEANAIVPGKRMLSSMAPTIIEKDGEFFMSLGSPGGSTIITSVLQVFLNVAEFNLTAEDALSSKRFHHQWLPDEVQYEPKCFSDSLMAQLSQMGHVFRQVEYIGSVECILRLTDGTYQGAADPRRSSQAEGF